MSSPFLLRGTAEELKSPRALKVLATALYGSVPLTRSEVSSQDELQSLTTPLAKSLVLSIEQHNSPPVHVTTSHAMMRTIAAWAPALVLLGTTEMDKAWVDGWVSFVWSSLELPFEATQVPEATNVCQEQIHFALAKLNDHLQYQTYMVGDQVTLADIALVVALHNAESRGWSDAAKAHDNVERWYQTMVHQDFIVKALQLLPKLSASTVSTPASSSSSSGILMNGVAPPVVNRLFRRNRIRIKEILADEGSMYVGQEVTVAGWARTTRNANKGQLLFVELTDGSTGKSLQCVLDSANTAGFEECKNNGGTGASYQLVGKIIASPAAGQAVECQVTKGEVLGPVYGGDAEGTKIGGALYPLSTKNPTLELYREVAHLRPRGKFHAAAMRIRHAMAYATHTFFHNNGFLYIHTPIITGADCEGAGEQFAVTTMLTNDHLKTGITLPVHEPPPPPDPEKKISKSELKRLQKQKEAAAAKADPNKPEDVHVVGAVDYSKDFFSRRVNLTVSGQLNVETHACALSDVYTFGPTFRAENSNTYRHLSEFWMIEPEIAFADLNTDINLAEDYLKYCVEFAMDRCAEDLEFFENHPHGEPGLRERLRNVLDNPFKRLPYTEAIEILQKAVADGTQFEEKVEWGMDLPSEMERFLCEQVFKKPVVLTDYPKEIKAFYMKLNDDGKTVAAADILVPKIGEIIGGSQREHRLDVLKARCIESGLDPRAVWWYLDLRRYGSVPHAGFGLGFERLILFVTGIHNIRDVIPFPRWAGNADF